MKKGLDMLIALQQDMDVIILEGMKYSAFPKIEIVRSAVSSESVCQADTLLALVTDTELRIKDVPYVALDDFEGVLKVVRAYLNAS